MAARVTLISKADCELCAQARTVIAAVCADLSEEWEEIFIESDPTLAAEYWTDIPVTLVDGQRHDYWRVDPQRLRAALLAS